MAFTVVLLSIHSMKAAELINMGNEARRPSIVALSALRVFAALFTLAIAKSRRAELHKRLMPLAMIALCVPLSATAAWMSIATYVEALAG